MDTFGSDDERPRSPPLLEPQTIRYKPEESPPPFLPEKSSSSRDSTPPPAPGQPTKPVKKRRKRRTQPSQGDAVLISYLDPNRPDIARAAGEETLNSDSQSEAEWADGESMGRSHKLAPNNDQVSDVPTLTKTAQHALNQILTQTVEPLDVSAQPNSFHHEQPRGYVSSSVNGVSNVAVKKEPPTGLDAKDTKAAAISLQKLSESSEKGRRTPKIKTSSDEKSGEESSITSPILRQYKISASEGSPMQTLPAIQRSPPGSASAASPDGTQSLPSLQTALADAEINDPDVRMNGSSPVARTSYHPFAGQSPPLNRTDRQIPAHYPPPQAPTSSPYPCQTSPQSGKDVQGMSPPGSTNPQLWRNSKPETPYTPSTLSDQQPTPQSTTEGSSAHQTPAEHRMSIDGERPGLLNGPMQPNGPFTSSGFKCTNPGCTAAPFQTQYLLNSHANVHSQNRPHYCHVKDCPRGVGGKGFKRKNEMIRHGLVHASPGYVCPFCPDQQHKYPRPDNLQRHVRVHHVDKDRDDAQLRHVLAQRPEGGNRNRRKRIGP